LEGELAVDSRVDGFYAALLDLKDGMNGFVKQVRVTERK